MLPRVGQQLGRGRRASVAASAIGRNGVAFHFPCVVAPYLTGQAYKQAAKAAAAPPASAEQYIQMAKREEPSTTVEPGIVADVELANVVYTIPEGDGLDTPTLKEVEMVKDEGDSDVSIGEVLVVKEAEICASRIQATPTSSSERGEPLVSLAWPPRVLEHYPLTIRTKSKREPQAQPGSLGGTSLGGVRVPPASSSSDHVLSGTNHNARRREDHRGDGCRVAGSLCDISGRIIPRRHDTLTA